MLEKKLDFEGNLEKSIAGIDGQLLHLLVVFRVCSIVIAIGPKPQLENRWNGDRTSNVAMEFQRTFIM